MFYNLISFDSIGDSIVQALRTLMASIGALLYSLIDYLYQVFIYVGKAEILENDFVQSIYRKVGMILGIFMVFKLAFSLVQSLVSPDKFTDSKNGYAAIIGRCVISIVLLGIIPSLFREAFKIQNIIVGGKNSDNIIYKLISTKNAQGDMNDMGRIIASDLYFSFFTDNEAPYLNNGTLDKIYESEAEYQDRFVDDDFINLEERVRNRDIGFDETVSYLAIKDSSQGYVIEYNWLLSLAMAIAMIVIFITYCIQVGARVVQLAYLQIIAPIPILSYISDPDGSFKRWTKQCTTTFLDLFLRLAIIYFAVTMIGEVINQFNRAEGIIFDSTGLESGTFTALLVKIFIILGLLIFAKRVPELLKDLFPNLGGGPASLGFGIKDTFKDLKESSLTKIGWSMTKPVRGMGKFAWKKTGGRGIEAIKNKHKIRKDDRSAYKEQNRLDKESNKVWEEYGNDFETNNFKGAFKDSRDKNGEYAASYEELKRTKDALKGFSGDTNSAEYRALLAEKEKAEKNHNVNRDKYKELARREDQLKRYNDRHPKPNNGGGGGSNNNSSSNFPTTNSSSPQQNINNNQSSSLRDTQQSSNVPHRPDQYDERMEYATNRYYELQDSGASDEQLQQQLDNIRNLTQGREEAERYYRDIDNQIDDANERNNDGFGGQ